MALDNFPKESNSVEKTNDRIFLLDLMALVYRSHFAFSRQFPDTASPKSALYGVARFLNELLTTENPSHIYVATDTSGPTFRHEMFDGYKAQRSPMPEEIRQQLPDLFKLFETAGIKVFKQEGFEADDLLGSLATTIERHRKQSQQIFIVSGDKDFFQLVSKTTSVYGFQFGKPATIYDEPAVFAKMGCHTHQIIDFLALMGDASDSVPGINGIGRKGATKLLEDFGTLDQILENASDDQSKMTTRHRNAIRDQHAAAEMSRKLVTIKTNIDLDDQLADTPEESQQPLPNKSHSHLTDLAALYASWGFHTLASSTLAMRPIVTEEANEFARQEVDVDDQNDDQNIDDEDTHEDILPPFFMAEPESTHHA